jgi:putative cell wall-binding protein
MLLPVKARLAVAAVAASTVSVGLLAPSMASAATSMTSQTNAANTANPANAADAANSPNAVNPTPPTAVAVTTPGVAVATVGYPVTLTATGGTVAVGTPLYNYDFGVAAKPAGDTQLNVAGAASFTYTAPGTYTATVTTTDGTTTSAKATKVVISVVAASLTPTVHLTATPAAGSASATQPFTVTLDATKSIPSTLATGALTFSAWSCGVGGPVPQAVLNAPGKQTCTFTTPGTYTVSVTVTDSNLQVSTGTTTITVTNPAAPNVAPFSAAPGTSPLTATASLAGVTVDKSAVKANTTYVIAWGDGKQDSYTGVTKPSTPITHTYATAGTYHVVLTVNDGLNLPTSIQSVTIPVAVAAVPAGPTPVNRFAGSDRFDTGVKLSKYRWAATTDTSATASHPGAVVLATGTNFPDALAGVPLTAKLNAALLLTAATGLTPEVAAEIQRILPADKSHTVYILGGGKAVSKTVDAALIKLGYTVVRYAGVDRFDTALQIAKGMGDPMHVIVARGDDFADALAAGPLAAHVLATGSGATYEPAAIVLSDGPVLDGASKAYVQSKLNNGGISVVAVGGQAAQALAGVPGIVTGSATQAPNVGALFGADRFATAAMVAKYFASFAPVGVATGLTFADALTGGAYMASVNGPLLLTDVTEPFETAQAVAAVAGTTSSVDVFGGDKAVSPSVFNNLVAAVKGVAKVF